jgi:hypothetical protein
MAALTCFVGTAGIASAVPIPTLQMDIGGGFYNTSTNTVMTNDDQFTLYALLIPDAPHGAGVNNTYYLSAAIVPQTGPLGASLGSFRIGSTTINVTGDMTYGLPPIETNQGPDPGDLPPHGIFQTFFSEIPFTFSPSNTATPYDSRLTPGGPTPDPTGGMYYAAFDVDIRNLAPGYAIHFDFYNEQFRNGGDIDVQKWVFADSDAQSGTSRVPEAGTLLLLGSGLVIAGLGVSATRRSSR